MKKILVNILSICIVLVSLLSHVSVIYAENMNPMTTVALNSVIEEQNTTEHALNEALFFQTFTSGLVTISGNLPFNGRVEAKEIALPETAVSDGYELLVAYDITIYDKAGIEFQPEKPVSVSIMDASLNHVSSDNIRIVHIKESGQQGEAVEIKTVSNDTVAFKAEHFSIYMIETPIQASLNTQSYHFFDVNRKLISTQKVKLGDTLYEPQIPVEIEGKTFVGWFKDDLSGEKFVNFTKVDNVSQDGEQINLYARYEDSILINYHDQQGNVIFTRKASNNDTYTILSNNPVLTCDELTECQVGWKSKDGQFHIEKTAFKDLSPEVKELTLTDKRVDLYPIVKTGYWISFDTGKGTVYEKQFIPLDAQSKKVSNPGDPQVQGYIFDAWYKDDHYQEAFSMDEDIDQSLTLYAKYKPDLVTYKVQAWLEDPNLGEYVKWGIFSLTGEVGTEPFSPIVDLSKTQGVEFNREKTDAEAVLISADGSTIKNSYYDSKTYSLAVHFKDEQGTSVVLEYDNLKYNISLRKVWDDIEKYNTATFQVCDLSKQRWYSSTGQDLVANNYDENSYNGQYKIPQDEVWTVEDRFIIPMVATVYHEIAYDDDDNLEGVVTNQSSRGRNTDTRKYRVFTSFELTGKAGTVYKRGEVPFAILPEISDGNYQFYQQADIDYVWIRLDPMLGFIGEDNLDSLKLYCSREKYNLIFRDANRVEESTTTSVYYDSKLKKFKPLAYIKGETESTDIKGQKFIFDGWYKTADFDGEEVDFDIEKMPHMDLYLYAKWKPITYTVIFDSKGGSEIKPQEGVVYGDTAREPQRPTKAGYTFLGWTLDDKVYNFQSEVSKNITLVAQYRSDRAYQVYYDANGGRGKAPQDNKEYYEEAGAVILSGTDMLEPEGKVFLGWKCEEDDTMYYPGSVALMKINGLHLKAIWGDEPKAVSFLYNFNYDTFNIKDYKTLGIFNKITGLLENDRISIVNGFKSFGEAPTNYEFTGWYLEKECLTRIENTIQIDSMNMQKENQLYAGWKQIEAPIVLDPTNPTVSEKPTNPTVSEEPTNPTVSEKPTNPTVAEEPQKTPVTHKTVTLPSTGERSNPFLSIIILGIACLGVWILSFYRRKIN